MLDGEHEVNEVFFDNVEVPPRTWCEENKGWTYAKYLLAHERTNIADVNRAKRELERLKRIAKAEGVFEDSRFRDQIALLEVDIVALEMMVLRVLSAEKSGKQSLDVAGLLKIRGSEIQQRYTELLMLAGGPFSLPFIHEAMEAGCRATTWAPRTARRWPATTSTTARPPSTAVPTKCNATSLRRPSWDDPPPTGFAGPLKGARPQARQSRILGRRLARSVPCPYRFGQPPSELTGDQYGLRFHRRPGIAARRGAPLGGQGLRLRTPPWQS